MCRFMLYLPDTIEAVLSVSLSPLGGGHTSVSWPHPSQSYPHNIPWPKSGSPNMASSSNLEPGEPSLSMFDLSPCPSDLISKPSAAPAQPNARGLSVHSVPPLHIPHIHIPTVYPSPLPSPARGRGLGFSRCAPFGAVESLDSLVRNATDGLSQRHART